MVPIAREALGAESSIQLAAVATAFPSGQLPLDLRLEEVRRTVAAGATEIDMVISRGAFLAGDLRAVFDEIVATKEACDTAHLKVILETGELRTLDNVAAASRLAIDAGADFIKTSTGKIKPAATLNVTLVMFEAIRDHYLETGVRIGMKPAGGIRDAKLALHYLVLLAETLGSDWMTPDLFRFGASSLVNDLLRQIIWKEENHYPSPRRFSVD
jgi:deoxyribose-phosphate aldolase